MSAEERNGHQDWIAGLAGEIGTLIQETLMVKPGSPNEDMVAAGVLDSLTLIQLLVNLEEHFAVTIPLSELEIDDISSITSLARLVASRKAALTAIGEGH